MKMEKKCEEGFMWKTYKLSKVLLLFVLLLSFAGCGKLGDMKPTKAPAEAQSATESETDEALQTGFIDISDILKKNQTLCYSNIWENKIFLFYTEEKSIGKNVWGIMLYDMEHQQILKNVAVEDLEAFENSANFYLVNDHEILVCNDWEDVGLIYDYELQTDGVVLHDLYEKYPDYVYNYKDDMISEEDTDEEEEIDNDDAFGGEIFEEEAADAYEDASTWEEISYKPEMPLAVMDQWGTYNGYKQFGESVAKAAVIFNGQPDLVCIGENKVINQIVCCSDTSYMTYEDTMSTSTDPDAWEKPHAYSFEINRITTKETLNAISTPEYGPNYTLSMHVCAMNDTYAFLVFSDYEEEQYSESIYLWNYMADADPAPMDDFEVYHESDLDQKNLELIAQIEDAYKVHIITPYQQEESQYSEMILTMIISSYDMDLNLGKAECYVMLNQLDVVLGYFPKGMFEDIIKDSFDEYAIYLVQEFLDPAVGAFASNMWLNSELDPEEANGEDIAMTGQVFACFAAKTFAETHIPHEIMHTMEYRLDGELMERWYGLNPETFSYEMDLYDNPEQTDSLDFDHWDYFMSLYATKNELEDRAVTFETLFMSSLGEGTPYWLDEPHLNEKAKFLADAIHACYPSVQAADEVLWEKYVKTE